MATVEYKYVEDTEALTDWAWPHRIVITEKTSSSFALERCETDVQELRAWCAANIGKEHTQWEQWSGFGHRNFNYTFYFKNKEEAMRFRLRAA